MSQVAVSGRRAVPGLSQAWIALCKQKALFFGVSIVFFAGFSMLVLMAPREFHVLAEVPVVATSGDPRDAAEALSAQLADPDEIGAAAATLEPVPKPPVLVATPSADGKTILIEARSDSPQRAGDLINALLRRKQSGQKQVLLSAAEADLAEARKQRDAAQASLAAAQAKLAAIAKENAARNARNKVALGARSEAERRQAQQARIRNRQVSEARARAQSHARSLQQALERRRYIGVRIDVLVDEIQGLRARLGSTPETVTDVKTRANAYGQELRLRLEGLQADREDLVASRGASDPAVREIDGRIRRMRQRVAAEPAETREETKRPNPLRATIGARLRGRESELAAITVERGEVLRRIASLQSRPVPREAIPAPAPALRVAAARLEPVLDAAPFRKRLEAATRKRQEAEAEVQRIAQRQRDLQASASAPLPSLQYPAPAPPDYGKLLMALGAALIFGLMAVAGRELRSRRLASPRVRLRRRRTIEDRSRELIEGPPVESEPQPEPKTVPELDPEPVTEPTAQLIPQPVPLVEPQTRRAPTPEPLAELPPPRRAREAAPTFVSRPTPVEPLPIPDTSAAAAPEMPVVAPPPAYLRTEPTFVARATPIEPPPIPDTSAAAAPEMAVIAPPLVFERTEPTLVAPTRTIEPVPLPDTQPAPAPEIEVLGPPLAQIEAIDPTLFAGTIVLEPPPAVPESLPIPQAELAGVAAPLLPSQAPEASLVERAAVIEPPDAVVAPSLPTRQGGRVRVVRRRITARQAVPETLPVPMTEPVVESPPTASDPHAETTFVGRTQIAVPIVERPAAPLVEAEPVREWVELSPADLVPDEVVQEPEADPLLREAVFSGQPVTLLEAPSIAIPAPMEPQTVAVPRRRAVPRPKTRPKPLRELASLSRNLNPLTAALDPSSATDAEALNRIRDTIEMYECRTLLVCGAHRGDGASHTALLIAAYLSSRGWPVVLVDADFRHRTLHRALRVPHLPGFSEFLMELADYREVLQETEYERLAAVSAGPLLADPALLLEPMRVDRAIRILRDLGALVIIDGGSTLSEVQAELLAPFADGVLLVSRHGKGGNWTLKKANERLHAVQASVLGLIRNPHRS